MVMEKTKKILCLLMSVMIVLSVSPIFFTAKAEDAVTEDGFVWRGESTSKAHIVGYKGNEKNITIPMVIEGRTVTAIQVNAFQNNTTIETVIFPETIMYVCQYAFTGCTSLKSINIPAATIAIQIGAFEGCTSLTDVKLFEGLEEVAKRAFFGCTSLESITLPEGVKKIDNMAFQNCSALKTIVLPTTLREIGHSVFMGCTSFEETTLYESVAAIGDNAFKNVPETAVVNVFTLDVYKKLLSAGFKGIVLGAPVENPADYEYTVEDGKAIVTKYKGSDDKISIPAELGGYPVYVIGESAFKNCSQLVRVYMPVTALKVSDSAFEGCTSLTLIAFPEDFSYIGERAFYDCKSLLSVTVPYTVTYIGKDAFANLSANAVVCVTVTEVEKLLADSGYNGNVTFVPENDPKDYVNLGNANAIIKQYTGSKTKISIPEYLGDNLNMPVTAITNYGMSNLRDVVSIIIPETVSWIGEYGFAGNVKMQKVQLPQDILFINSNTFENCEALKEINIPKNVIGIESLAFHNCKSLETIVIPEGVEYLGEQAFAGCKELKSITIPSTVKNIGDKCFDSISKEAVIYVSNLETKQLLRNSGLTDCDIYVEGYGIESYDLFRKNKSNIIGATKNAYTGEETKIIVPSVFEDGNATIIPATLFAKNKDLETVVISEGITEIKAQAFLRCESLKTVVLPSTLTKIGKNVFKDVPEDCVVYVPNNDVLELVRNVFNGIVKGVLLSDTSDYGFEVISKETAEAKITAYTGTDTEIKIPDKCELEGKTYSVAYIEADVFKASKVTKVEIPDSVLGIGNGLFADCAELESVKLPKRLTKISDSAFENCVAIKNVECGEEIAVIGNNAFKNSGIAEFDLPVNMFEIGNGAFENCGQLEKLVIPDSITAIGSSAFNGCNNLTIEANSTEIGKLITASGFKGTVTGVPVTRLEDYVFTYYQSNTKAKITEYKGTDKEIAIPAYTANGIPVCTIGLNAFAYNTNLTKIIMPDTVTDIEGSAFECCVNVKYFKLSNSLVKLGNRVFQGMGKLRELKIPESLTSVPAYAFRHNYSVTELTIPDSLISIEAGAFYFNTGLRKVIIPDTLESIAANAFDTFDKDTVYYCSDKMAEMLNTSKITGIVSTEKPDAEDESTLLYYSYNSEEAIDKIYTKKGDETSITYDAAEKAAKIAAKDLNGDGEIKNAGTFYVLSDGQSEVYDSQISTEKYPYLVLTVKIPSNTVAHNSAEWVTSYSRELRLNNSHPGRGTDTFISTKIGNYKNESGWQTIVISDTENDFMGGNWVSIGLKALSGKTANDGDFIWVKEARLLTEKEYEGYFASSSSTGSTLVDFTLERNFELMSWSDLADTYACYDKNVGTAMICAKDAVSGTYADGVLNQQTAYFSVAFKSVPVSEYPILAIRLKLKNKAVSSGWYSFKTTDTIKEDGSLFYDIMKPVYTATDEWQTIIIDCSKNNAMEHMFMGNWISAAFNLTFTGSATEDDVFWVEWVGVFKSVDDAKKASDANILTKKEENKDNSSSDNNGFDFGDIDFELDDDVDGVLREPQRIEKVTKKTVIIPGTDYTPIVIGVSVGAVVLVALGVFLLLFLKKRKKAHIKKQI